MRVPDARRSEGGVVGRVGKELALERYAIAHSVHVALLSDQRAIEEIASIDLDSRLVGKDFEYST